MRIATTLLVFCVTGLLALGLTMLFSASNSSAGVPADGAKFLMAQLKWCVLAIPAAVAAACFDYRLLKRWWPLLMGITVVLLAYVLLFEKPVNGARRWIIKGGYQFQPSEMAKLALVIFLAWYGERFAHRMKSFLHGVMIPCAAAGVILALIFREPDVGTTLLLTCVSCLVLLSAGAKIRYLVLPACILLTVVGAFVATNANRSERIHSWLNLEETRRDRGAQQWQAQLAIGAGGLAGKGLGEGRQKMGWVPEHHTDFIFAVVAEELGFVGGLFVILAFLGVLVAGMWIALHASDIFGALLAIGITSLIAVQAFINIGVVTATLPNKGLALPFISYGGSSLLFMLVAIGVLLSVARQARPRTVEAGSTRNPFSDLPLAEAG